VVGVASGQGSLATATSVHGCKVPRPMKTARMQRLSRQMSQKGSPFCDVGLAGPEICRQGGLNEGLSVRHACLDYGYYLARPTTLDRRCLAVVLKHISLVAKLL
jgi:hypothetical protein